MLTSSTSIVNLIHKGHLDIHDSQGPNFASLDLFDEFFKVLIPLPVGRLDMMLRALGTSKAKASRDSYQADIHKDI